MRGRFYNDLQFQLENCERVAKAKYHRTEALKYTTRWKQQLEVVKDARAKYDKALQDSEKAKE